MGQNNSSSEKPKPRTPQGYDFKSSNEPTRPVPSSMYPSLSSTNTPTYQPSQLDRPLFTSVTHQQPAPANNFATPFQPNYPPLTYTSYTPTGNFAQRAHQPQVNNGPPTTPRECAGQFVIVQNPHQTFQPSAPPATVVWSPSQPTSIKTNTKTFKPQKKNQDSLASCTSCKKTFGIQIYQCGQGHSSCDKCKMRNVPCGSCKLPISNTRNYTMEAALKNVRSPCLNAEYGCILSFMMKEMQLHLQECPYSKIICPVASMLGTTCYWIGEVSEIAEHFKSYHIERCQSDVDKEMRIFNIAQDSVQIHLVELGIYKFLVLLKVSKQENNMYMTVQFLGTKVSAEKWIYEFHVFNKSEPRRKYQYNDRCQSLGTPLKDIFDVDNGNNACLPLNYASSFLNRGSLTYKFYIKKTVDDKEISNNDDRGDGHGDHCGDGRGGGHGEHCGDGRGDGRGGGRGGGRGDGRGRGGGRYRRRNGKRVGLSRPTTPDPKN